MINSLKEIANNPIVLWRALASRRISDMTDILSQTTQIVLEYHIIFYIIANISAENGQNCINRGGPKRFWLEGGPSKKLTVWKFFTVRRMITEMLEGPK